MDVWTFTANAGERIAVHIGEITDTDDFRPWIRLWAPNGATLGVILRRGCRRNRRCGRAGHGHLSGACRQLRQRLQRHRHLSPHDDEDAGPITVSAGDQGGPLTNGGVHTGEILRGDLDVWTFTATAGDRIAVHIGEITDTDDFRPWIRLWAPEWRHTWVILRPDAAEIGDVVAPVTGTYLVLVGSFDSGVDGTGTYRLTMAQTPGPVTVSPGDRGRRSTNGGVHTGEILRGDLDVWTFTATAGDRIAVHIGEITETDDFRPWIRVWAPNGATLGSSFGLMLRRLAM